MKQIAYLVAALFALSLAACQPSAPESPDSSNYGKSAPPGH